VGAVFSFGACAHVQVTHVPPGESVNVALAKKPEVVRLPVAPTAVPHTPVARPAVEPALPADNTVERVAEAYTRGGFCMSAGKDQEAIEAFEEAVKIDPGFGEAWQHLAMLYEKKGESKKALDAFRRAKKPARG
jgi:Tfp pilus assembly protein PilF